MSDVTSGRMATVEDVSAFVLGGNATITLVSARTSTRFTYRIHSTEEGKVGYFVSVLNGADNESSYAYLGHVFNGSHDYVHGRKSRVHSDAPSAKAFAWFWERAIKRGVLPDDLECWHDGHCGRCGRKLTVPESIARGLGPECATRGLS